MITRQARVLLQPSSEFGYLPEGPRVLPDGRLLWISIQLGKDGDLAARGALHTVDLTTGEGTAWELPGRPGFALPGADENVFLVGMERSIGWLDLHTGTF